MRPTDCRTKRPRELYYNFILLVCVWLFSVGGTLRAIEGDNETPLSKSVQDYLRILETNSGTVCGG